MQSFLEILKSDQVLFLGGAIGIEILRRGEPMSDADWAGPLAAYPDSGDFFWPNLIFEDNISPEELRSETRGWFNKGVQLFGGCCGLGPEHITLMREMLPQSVLA